MIRSLALVLVASVLAAGCILPEADPATAADQDLTDIWSLLSPILFDDMIVEHAPVESYDGTIIDNWVFRPKTAAENETVPVIINFSPYWGNLAPTAASGGDAFSQYLIDFFVPRGYAAVLSSARGTGHSRGCFTIGGEPEMLDSKAMIEHFAALPWSSGNVAAGGKSYDGTMPHGALVKAPAALKTIIPVSGISELYKYNYVNGVPYGQGRIFNAYYVQGVGIEPPSDAEESELPFLLADEACPEQVGTQLHGLGSGVTGDYTDYWMERNYTAHIPEAADLWKAAGVDVATAGPSVYFIHGLADWNVKPDHILPWTTELQAEGIVVKQLLGQWPHEYPTRDDWNLTMLRWLDHWLKGIDTGILDEPLVNVEDNQGVWRTEDNWPPTRVNMTPYYLQADGKLSTAVPPTDAHSSVTFMDNGNAARPDAAGAPTGHYVLFETEPFTTDMHMAGEATATLDLMHSTTTGQIIVTMWDVSPDGVWTEENWGIMSYRHRNSLQDPEPVMPNAHMLVNLNFYPQDDVFKAGHRLAVTFAGAGGLVAPVPSFGETMVHIGGETPSVLYLPLVDAEANAVEEPQPLDVGCWAC